MTSSLECPASRRGSRRLAALLVLAMSGACSVLEPTYTADSPGRSGKAPVEVTVSFEGNKGITSNSLRGRIEDYMLDLSRDPTRESAVYDAALEVEDYYRLEGYPVATVDYEFAAPAEGAPWPESVHVLLKITAGPLVTVAMTLSGNEAYASEQLLALWTRRRSGTFRLGGVIFVEAQIHAFVEELRAFYRARARLDTVVEGPTIQVDLEAGLAKVDIVVREGPVHTIRAVEVDAAMRTALGPALPESLAGKPYAQGELYAYRNALRTALRKLGYPSPEVELTAAPIEGAPRAWRLTVSGKLGTRATVSSLVVAGNDKTIGAVILGKLSLRPGDRYDGTKVDAALLELYRTGLFHKVDIREVPTEDDPTQLDIAIQVEEVESRSVEFLAGYGSYERARGGLLLEERNLFGTGRGIALDNRVSMKGYGSELTVTDSDFLSTRSMLTVTGEFFRREEPSFTDEAAGVTLAVSRPLLATLTGRVGYTYRERTDAEALTSAPQNQLVDFVEGKLFFELRNDRRDNLLFPNSGHSEFLRFERLAPEFGASVDLDRLTVRLTKYIPLVDPLRLVLRTEQSVVWPHEGSARVPLQIRWFNGGESTVRSFRESELGPTDNEGIPVGGEYRNIFGAELRLPLWRTFEAAIFADAGNVGARVQDFSLDDMRYGLGAGLRLLLPIGPVRVDAGWNPDREPGDDEWVVHVSVGYPF